MIPLPFQTFTCQLQQDFRREARNSLKHSIFGGLAVPDGKKKGMRGCIPVASFKKNGVSFYFYPVAFFIRPLG